MFRLWLLLVAGDLAEISQYGEADFLWCIRIIEDGLELSFRIFIPACTLVADGKFQSRPVQ